jgi:serine protease Do
MLMNLRKQKSLLTRAAILTLAATTLAPSVEGQDSAVGYAKALSSAFRYAAESTTPAVVTIRAQISSRRSLLGREYVGPDGSIYAPAPSASPQEEDGYDDSSIGSGIIIERSGVVLTNSHVIEGADKIIVELADGQEFLATDIKRDADSDVAILRLKNAPKDLPVAKLGDSDQLATGDWVIAIGSPFELEATVSAGIISGKGRGISKIRRGKLLQTDAAINPGNSGGPLVNLDGEVIGINTAIASSSGGYQGIGFAIPINHARWVLSQLHEYGEVRRSYLGVNIENLTRKEAIKLGIPSVAGVFVTQTNAAAASAGLRVRDVIVEFAGTPVRDSRDLQNVVERKAAGSRHPIKLYRDGQARTFDVVLGLMPKKSK